MVRRWQLALWVLLGLILTVVVSWERASMSVDQAGGDRLETTDGRDQDPGRPDELAFGELDDAAKLDGDNNVLRPTTTVPPTTTTSTTAPTSSTAGEDGDPDSSTATTTVDDGTDTDKTSTGPTTTDGLGAGSTSVIDGGGGATTVPEPSLTTIYYQNFANGELLPNEWTVYRSAGHDGWGWRRRSAVDVVVDPDASGGHVLEITAGMGSGDEDGLVVSGGLKLNDHSLTYGRISFRARVDGDPDEVTAGVIHLWPADDSWPEGGEINIMATRNHRETRAPVQSDLHWVDDDQGHRMVEVDHGLPSQPTSAKVWHVYVLEWTPNQVRVTIDDDDPVVLTNSVGRVPKGPLDLAIQLDAADSPDRPGMQPTMIGDVRMQVDWILIEQRDEAEK